MTTLQDTLTTAIQKGFYRKTQESQTIYVQFKGAFGANGLEMNTYDKEGNQLTENLFRHIDSFEYRESFELVPESELPEKLRELSKE